MHALNVIGAVAWNQNFRLACSEQSSPFSTFLCSLTYRRSQVRFEPVWVTVSSALRILIYIPLESEAKKICKWVLYRIARVHALRYSLPTCHLYHPPEHWQGEFCCIALTKFSRMLRNLRSPAADDEVELVDDGDSVDIRYRLRRHCSKCRLFVLALVFLFLAGSISVVVFIHTKKSNSEGMWLWKFVSCGNTGAWVSEWVSEWILYLPSDCRVALS